MHGTSHIKMRQPEANLSMASAGEYESLASAASSDSV